MYQPMLRGVLSSVPAFIPASGRIHHLDRMSTVARFPEPMAPPGAVSFAPTQAHLAVKQAVDRCVAGVLLLAASPAMALIALAVKASSDGPVFFVQRRAGLGGCSFPMLKFRSMADGAHEMEDEVDGGDGPFFKVKDDARVTAIGRLLRKSSLDEIPQLINVLRGEMSLVGPRPILLREYEALPEDVREWRFLVRPGITGLWQVSGRSNTTDATRLRLDRLYVEHASVAMDLAILARTPAAVLRAEGAV
jgi:lipopolysaccharide/colanic/teichoic acid biosynthesis glycosyltransferase